MADNEDDPYGANRFRAWIKQESEPPTPDQVKLRGTVGTMIYRAIVEERFHSMATELPLSPEHINTLSQIGTPVHPDEWLMRSRERNERPFSGTEHRTYKDGEVFRNDTQRSGVEADFLVCSRWSGDHHHGYIPITIDRKKNVIVPGKEIPGYESFGQPFFMTTERNFSILKEGFPINIQPPPDAQMKSNKQEQITIREITSDDCGAYRDYYDNLKIEKPNSPHMYHKILDDPKIKEEERYKVLFRNTIDIEPKGSYVMFGFWHGEKMVGNGSIDLLSSDESGKKIAGIQGIELLRDYQARGLVEMYALAVANHLQRISFDGPIVTTIRPDNRPSLWAAKRNGFIDTGKVEHENCVLVYNGTAAEWIAKARQRQSRHEATSNNSTSSQITETYLKMLGVMSEASGVDTPAKAPDPRIADHKVSSPKEPLANSDIATVYADKKLIM